jgi:long-chain acyl-CoA synthetase
MSELTTLLDAACREGGRRRALAGAGGELTFRDLDAEADGIASALRRAAVRADEPAIVMVSNRPHDLVAFLGAWRAGAVAVPVHRSSPPAVRERLIEATRARLVIDAAGPGADVEILARTAPPERPLLRGAAFVIFTSGSTGTPKGAVLSHRAFAGKLGANDSLLGFTAGDRTLLVLNITFSFGIWVSLLTLARGGTLVMQEKFEPRAFLDTLEKERITRVGVVPTMMRALLQRIAHAGAAAGRDVGKRAQHLRLIMIGGEPLGAHLSKQIRALFPVAGLVDIFGLTETSTSDFILRPDEHDLHPGCIGRPGPNVEFRIADERGAALGHGEVGELQIRTPYIMNGYLDAPELTAAAFAGGYFRTGDVARLREDGAVELVGRAKELVSRGANKISPLEVEEILLRHPGVAAVLATGVADSILGERLHVLVVPRAGAALTLESLRELAAAHLEKFKRPDAYHLGVELPLGRTGKADRNTLRRMIEAGELG